MTKTKNDLSIDFRPLKKQYQALEYLQDKETTELLYGGGVGGGKSLFGCAWLIINCLQYPGTRWLMGRSKLTSLKSTTLKTFFELLTQWGLKSGTHYSFNGQSNELKFKNGSEVILKDLFLYPSDPEFDSLGSIEISGAFIDEAAQITEKAFNVVKSRLRFKLTENNLIGRVLLTCNPCKNFLYKNFYKPFKDNTILSHRKFIQALPSDNKHLASQYIESLNNLDKNSKERLLYGNWEYDDDESSLIDYESIVESFYNHSIEQNDKRYISCDVARLGADKTVIIVWYGLKIQEYKVLKQVTTDVTTKEIKELQSKHNVPSSHIIIDADGIGGGVVDQLSNVKSFVNNSSPLNKENFSNLKSQCYFKLAELINKKKIWINIQDPNIINELTQELEQVKRKDIDKDGKQAIIPKDDVKKMLGRSPDYSDAVMLRMYYEIKNKPSNGDMAYSFAVLGLD